MATLIRLKQIESSSYLEIAGGIGQDFSQSVINIVSESLVGVLPDGVISGSSQLTSSFDTRYVISGSITQTTWDNIANKPFGIVSGSEQVIGILSSLNQFTSSLDNTFATDAELAATSSLIIDQGEW